MSSKRKLGAAYFGVALLTTTTMNRIVCAALGVVLFPVAALAQVATPLGPQLNIAHRGASAYAPEHTFYAYDLAMEMDVDMLECDLFLTRDEVPVCIHDTTVDRTSDGSGTVESFTLAELRELDFGGWFDPAFSGAQIVPFEEQLDCYLRHNGRMRFHVETKDSAGGRAEEVLVEVLRRKGLLDTGDLHTSTILMQSFDAASLERIKALAPSLPTAFLFAVPTSGPALLWYLTGSGADYIDAMAPNMALLQLDPLVVQRFHAAGHDVHVWTVNDRETMDTALQMGVDGVFTNNPDVLRAAIDERGSGSSVEERANPLEFERGCPGVAGRVVSNQGPGDVWAPSPQDRGVVLVAAVGESPVDEPPQTEVPATDGVGSVRGGALDLAWLVLMLLAFSRHLGARR